MPDTTSYRPGIGDWRTSSIRTSSFLAITARGSALPAGAAAIATNGYVINWTPATAYSTAIGTSAASVTGSTNNWALVNGGVPLAAGDQINFVKGADATEVILNPVLECVVQPLANVSP